MPEQVRILRVTEAPAVAGVEGEVDRVAITYSASDVAPRTVFVDKEKDTTEERQRVIKQDLEAARAARPTFLDLP